MTRRCLLAFVAVALILVTMQFVGCKKAVSYTTSSLSEVTLTTAVDKKLKPTNATNVFSTNPPRIYCTFKLTMTSPSVAVKAEWIYVNKADGTEYLINYWMEITKGPQYMAMFVDRPPKGWPKGDYKVVLYVDDEEELSVPFRIK